MRRPWSAPKTFIWKGSLPDKESIQNTKRATNWFEVQIQVWRQDLSLPQYRRTCNYESPNGEL